MIKLELRRRRVELDCAELEFSDDEKDLLLEPEEIIRMIEEGEIEIDWECFNSEEEIFIQD